MKVAFFAPMSGLKAGGPESYDTEVARGIARVDRENRYTIYCVNPEAIESFGIRQPNFAYHVLRPRSRWLSIPVTLPLSLLRHRVDLLHATYSPPPFFPGPLVLTVHDISMFSHPHLYPQAIRLRLQVTFRAAIRRATRILASSEFTREALLERFRCDPATVVTVPLGVGRSFRPIEGEAAAATAASLGITRPYVLHVGRLQARKNIVRLLEAFDRLRRQDQIPHQLVLVGRESWEAAEVFETANRLGLGEDLKHIGYAPSGVLPALYSQAAAVVYPSLFEGFGLPILEAMACGAPVVTSNVTSLPEVAGDAAILVNPLSVDDLASGMRQVLLDEDCRGRLRRQGLARAATFSWERTVAQTLEVYRQTVSQVGTRSTLRKSAAPRTEATG